MSQLRGLLLFVPDLSKSSALVVLVGAIMERSINCIHDLFQ